MAREMWHESIAPESAEAVGVVQAARAQHEHIAHGDEFHHHHSHAATSRHAHGHHLLQVEDLSVSFTQYDPDARFFQATQREVKTIEKLNVSVHEGEIVAIVGASGSGKTLLADAVMGLFESNATVRGTVWFNGQRQDAAGLAALRGRGISLVPQSVSHLDPLMKVGAQVRGRAKNRSERARRKQRQRTLFERYGLPRELEKRYPFELSGGQVRRVLLMCALMDEPRVIVADEPTPGLDLELAVQAMDDLRAFADEGGGVLLITHDIELALRVADRVAVFKDGTVVEETAVEAFTSPERLAHPFSRELWHALPEHDFAVVRGHEDAKQRVQGTASEGEQRGSCGQEASAAQATQLTQTTKTTQATQSSQASQAVHIVEPAETARARGLEARGVRFGYTGDLLYDDFNCVVYPGERVALCAESGMGKTTLCRILAGYLSPQAGGVFVDGEPLPAHGVSPVQLIGQHPELMVDPRLRMRATLEETGSLRPDLCEALGIRPAWMRRFPHELSGGELQRFCIARALAASPRYLVCDEISTMLDAAGQAQLWRFLLAWCEDRGAGMVLVSHSAALVKRVATRTVTLCRTPEGLIRVQEA